MASTSDMSPEERVKHLAQDILNKMPEVIDYEHTLKVIGLNKKPLDVVLLQEIERYNKLLQAAKKGLVELQKGINGFVVMTDELDEMFYSMMIGQVPGAWKKGKSLFGSFTPLISHHVDLAYKSLKKLGSWTRDLIQRVEHFSKWAQTGHPPKIFWLAAFTFPTSYLTAVLQVTISLHTEETKSFPRLIFRFLFHQDISSPGFSPNRQPVMGIPNIDK